MAEKKIAFILKEPSEKDRRKTFSFLKRIPDPKLPGAYLPYEKVIDERINALNRALVNDPEQLIMLTKQAKELRASFYIEEERSRGIGVTVFNSDNLKLLPKFWKYHVSTKRPHRDPGTAYAEYRRAIESIGNLPLLTAPIEDLAREINRKHRGDAQRRLVLRLRSILRFYKREEDAKKLILDRADSPVVKALTKDEYQMMRTHLKPVDQIVCDCLVYSGMRVGELFATGPEHLLNSVLSVAAQIDSNTLVKTGTKNQKARKTFVFNEGIEALHRWWRIPYQERINIRNRVWSRVVHSACRKAFPGESMKDLDCHDLRHCFAVWLLKDGVSLDLIAKALGDSIAVADKHYVGFSLQSDAIGAIAARIEGGKVK